MQVTNMSDEKLYWPEILFYGITILAAFLWRVLFPFKIEDGPFLIPGLLFYCVVMIVVVQTACIIGCVELGRILARRFPERFRNVPEERKLLPRHFSAATSSIVTAFIVERIYHVLGNPVIALIFIFPLLYVSHEFARRLGPG